MVGAMGSDEHEDVVVRDLDLDMIRPYATPGSSTVIGGPTPTFAITKP